MYYVGIAQWNGQATDEQEFEQYDDLCAWLVDEAARFREDGEPGWKLLSRQVDGDFAEMVEDGLESEATVYAAWDEED